MSRGELQASVRIMEYCYLYANREKLTDTVAKVAQLVPDVVNIGSSVVYRNNKEKISCSAKKEMTLSDMNAMLARSVVPRLNLYAKSILEESGIDNICATVKVEHASSTPVIVVEFIPSVFHEGFRASTYPS